MYINIKFTFCHANIHVNYTFICQHNVIEIINMTNLNFVITKLLLVTVILNLIN